MTNYQLKIRDNNVQPHLNIEEEIEQRKNGLLTFTIRVDAGNIVDFNVTEYVDAKQKYGIIKALLIEQITIQEPGITLDNHQWS